MNSDSELDQMNKCNEIYVWNLSNDSHNTDLMINLSI